MNRYGKNPRRVTKLYNSISRQNNIFDRKSNKTVKRYLRLFTKAFFSVRNRVELEKICILDFR